MKKLRFVCCLFVVLGLSTYQLVNLPARRFAPAGGSAVCYGQVEVGVGLTPGLTSSKEEKTVEKSRDLFISELAEKFAYEEKDLQRLYRRGYGYTELIKLILISQKSAKPLTEVVKKRDKGKKLRIIAKDYEIDYSTIMEEAKQIREEINNSLLSGPTTLPLLPGTTEIENLH